MSDNNTDNTTSSNSFIKCPSCNINNHYDVSKGDLKPIICKYCSSSLVVDSDSEKVKTTKTTEPILEPIIDPIPAKKSSNKWKFICLTTILALAVSISVIGFQSFQVQSSSNKIRNLEQKAESAQKNLAQLESLTAQNQTISSENALLKNDIELKTKLLSELQLKASTQNDTVKDKDSQITKLETENKALLSKNTALVTENANLKDNANTVKDRINTVLGLKRG